MRRHHSVIRMMLKDSLEFDSFTQLKVINNKVVGFYKTRYVFYENYRGEKRSYLFPTTFSLENGKVKTTMVFGSVTDDFCVPNVQGTGEGTELVTASVGFHHYKLLMAIQHELDQPEMGMYGFHYKSFAGIIVGLDNLGFPFMRIAERDSINTDQDFFK